MATTLIAVVSSVVLTMITVPLYEAYTRLFVSTTAGASASELYSGNRLSQERVLSYTELLTGETLAQRTIDKLDLDVTAEELQERVEADSKVETVLISVRVRDESAVRARDIANALSDEFVTMVSELETPPKPGAQPDARVIVEQRAKVPKKPVVPKKALNILVGTILGLAGGIALALVRDFFDNTVKDQSTLEDVVGAGIVGTLPSDKARRADPAITFETDRSPIAEAFRKLRTNLQFLSVDNPPRKIVIASSVPNEGKTTTALNLALALAEAEHKVVLIDGDMRRPSLDKILNAVGSVGFSTVLSGSATLPDVLQTTEYPGLTFLASGPIPPNPSELLGSRAATRVLNDLGEQFDYVIVDTPPLLAVTDAAIVSTNCDGTLIIARFGSTKREQVAHAVDSLKSVGASLLGAVLSMTPSRGASAYNYNYHYVPYGPEEGQRDGRSESAVASKQDTDGGELARNSSQ
jgi:receptor protein-tyrosine kinase